MLTKATKIKVLLSLLTAVGVSAIGAGVAQAAESYTTNFVISAYYSPVPGQARYGMGSYEAEIRMNGGGVTTASGVKVADAPGCFLAAPPEYPFGTVMDVEGIGTCEVLDRGGAFKNGLLRLDLWVGYGDEGLVRALTWGKRTVSVTVYGLGNGPAVTNLGYGDSYASLAFYQKGTPDNPLKFLNTLDRGQSGEEVARLQQLLKDLGYFKGEVDGVYGDSTVDAVSEFQMIHGVLNNPDLDNRGQFGNLTLAALDKAVLKARDEYFEFVPDRNLGRGASGDQVKKLQEILYRLGYLDVVTGVYDAATVEAVLKFQMSEGVLKSENDLGAGYFGPATQLAMEKLLMMIENDAASVAKVTDEEAEDLAFTHLEASELLTLALKEGDSGEEVVRLQKLLAELNFFGVEPTGYYGPLTSHAVYKFQQKMGIVKDKSDVAAGFVGPQTRAALNSLSNSKAKVATTIEERASLVADTGASYNFDADLNPGDRGVSVKMLQSFLKGKGYFRGSFTTEYFGEVTRSSLIAYQIDNNLIDSESDSLAGRLSGQTLSHINSVL